MSDQGTATAMLAGLLGAASNDPRISGLLKHVGEQDLHITAMDQARSWVIGALSRKTPVLLVTATSREAEDLTAELRAMVGQKVALFPAWETLPHERLSPGVDIVGKQAEVLEHRNEYRIIVASARAFRSHWSVRWKAVRPW